MIRLRALTALTCFLVAGACSPALGQAWPKKAYDATYDMTAAGRTMKMRMISDGQGRVRQEMTTPQGRVISILDYPNKVMWSLMEAQKMAMKMPLNQSATGPSVKDAESAKQMGAKSLGTKVIDGHPCQGWQVSQQGSTSESWIGTDIDNLVYSVSKSPQGESSMKLKQFSAAKPNASDFTVPSGYKVMAVPTGMAGR